MTAPKHAAIEREPSDRTGTGGPSPLVTAEPLLDHGRRQAGIPKVGAAAARALVHRFLRGIEGGEVVLVERGVAHGFHADAADRYGRDELRAVVQVHDPRFHIALVTRRSSGLGEAYRLGWFDTDDLTAFLRLLGRALRRFEPPRRRLRRATAPLTEPLRRLRRPDPDRDRRNIAAHYDIGNAFFELFLDETLTYSSGWFEHPGASLAEASRTKLDRLCRKLELSAGQRIVEIGTGWGSFAIHAASTYGVDVVTTTLSAEQHRTATRRVAEAGLADRVEVRRDHYRDLRGRFDAVVAVEMIEAVDWRELDDFVAHCARLTVPAGAVGLQAIVTMPARYSLTRDSRDFLKTHIFPGGSLASVPSILEAAARRTDLFPAWLSDFGLHYAETLRRWRANLGRRRHDALDLGLDEAFLRLWEFYLCYCEAGFEERQVSVVQLVLARPGRSASLRASPPRRPAESSPEVD